MFETIFYILLMPYILWEMFVYIDMDGYIKRLKAYRAIENFDHKKITEYPKEAQEMSVLLKLMLPIVILSLIGILTIQWELFLIWNVIIFFVYPPLSKKFRYSYIYQRTSCIFNIGYIGFLILNHFHMNYTFNEITNYLSNMEGL